MKPHKHAELIKAWADGHEIEYRFFNTEEWRPIPNPTFSDNVEYRIKPEEKKPVVRYLWADEGGNISKNLLSDEEIKNYGLYIKLEWSRTEFPE